MFILVLPAKSTIESGDPRVIHASQILAEISQNRLVEYDNVVITGDLDLGNRETSSPGLVISPITVKNSEIYGLISFNNTVMKEPVSFERVTFHAPVYFSQTKFQEGVSFYRSQFNETASFRESLINGSANFKEVRFNGLADFRNSYIVTKIADFRGAHFRGAANFVATKFEAENTNFEWSQFDGPAKFWHSTFGEIADFRGSHFADIVDLYRVQFNDTADFWGAEFKNEIYLNDAKFKTFKVQWASIGDKLNCNGQPYLLLIKNFRDLEQFEDADSCYYQYRNWRRDNRPLGWLKFLDYISWLSCGYGVFWHHTILTGMLVTILFGIYYETKDAESVLLNHFLRKNTIKFSLHEFVQKLAKMMLLSTVILLSLPSDWYPYGKYEYAKSIQHHLYSAILERLVGWGLMLLLIGTLSRLMVRY